MLVFLLVVLVLLILSFLIINSKGQKNQTLNNFYKYVSFLILLIISGFRGLNVGNDTIHYVRAFSNFNGISDSFRIYVDRYEIGYRILNGVVSTFTNNPHVLLLCCAFITLFCFYKFVYKNSKYPWLSILLFVLLMYFVNSMCIMRQYIAIGLSCIAISYLVENKKIKYLIFVLLATTFHFSAIFVLLLLPLSIIKINNQKKFLYFSLVFLFALSFNYLIDLFVKIVPMYSKYFTSEKYYLSNRAGSFFEAILQGIVFLIINYCYKKVEIQDDEKSMKLAKIGYFCSLITFCVSVVSIYGSILERMRLYFSVVNCITIPNILYSLTKSKEKTMLLVVIISISLLYFLAIMIFRPYWSGVIPYVFWE